MSGTATDRIERRRAQWRASSKTWRAAHPEQKAAIDAAWWRNLTGLERAQRITHKSINRSEKRIARYYEDSDSVGTERVGAFRYNIRPVNVARDD